MMLLGMGLYQSGWLARPKTPRDRKVAGAAVAAGACLSAAGVAWVAAEGFGARAAVPTSWVSRSTLWLAMAALWMLQLWASEVWLRTFAMGTLEWAWRCTTYRGVEPLLR